MSDMAEYYQEKHQKEQQQKAKRLKNNTELVELFSGVLRFEMQKHSVHHFSLFHPVKGRLDYWPSTGRAMWIIKKSNTKPFTIHDIENFLMTTFG